MEIERFDDIEDVVLIKPRVFSDERGYFLESFNESKFKKATGFDVKFIQDNESLSKKGTLRGFHYQKPPFAQAKLVRVVKGEVLDVVVDLRPKSKTYGHFKSFLLNEANKHQLFVPRGFAHAFLVLQDDTIFSYKVDNFYAPDHDAGIIYSDDTLNIEWPLTDDELIISEKDQNLISLKQYFENPHF